MGLIESSERISLSARNPERTSLHSKLDSHSMRGAKYFCPHPDFPKTRQCVRVVLIFGNAVYSSRTKTSANFLAVVESG